MKLEDDLGHERKGQFYEDELEPIEDNRYLIERIIRKRKTTQGTDEFLVKWKGRPTNCISWVKAEDCAYS